MCVIAFMRDYANELRVVVISLQEIGIYTELVGIAFWEWIA